MNNVVNRFEKFLEKEIITLRRFQNCITLNFDFIKHTNISDLKNKKYGKIWVVFGSLLGRYWVIIGSFLGRSWVVLGSFLGSFWVVIGSLSGRYWVVFFHITSARANIWHNVRKIIFRIHKLKSILFYYTTLNKRKEKQKTLKVMK